MSDAATGDELDAHADEWLPVQEIGRRLGLSERTAQRYAAKLAEGDRQPPDKDGLRRVRVGAFVALTKEAKARQEARQSGRQTNALGDTSGQSSEAPPDTQATSGPTVGDASAGLIEQLRMENARLWAALEREQATVEKAQANIEGLTSELAQARRESQVMLGAVAAGRVQIGAAEPAAETENSELQKAYGDETQAAATETGHERKTTTAPWWAFWKAKTGN